MEYREMCGRNIKDEKMSPEFLKIKKEGKF